MEKSIILFLSIKKENIFLRKNRSISLLPIFSKVFERIIHSSLFKHFISNKRFTPSQSNLLPGDSFIT